MRLFAKLLIIVSLVFPHTLHSNSDFKTCSIEFENFSQYLEQFQPCLDSQIEDNSIVLENLLKSDETAFLKENFNFDSSQLDLNKEQKKFIDQLIADEYEYSYGIHTELKDLRAVNSISEELYKNILTYYYDNLIDKFYELSDDYNLSVFVLLTGILGKLFEPDDSKTIDLSLSASSIAENSSDSITVNAVANEPVTADTTVSITLGGDASSPSDYTIASTTITISSGATTGSTTISLVDDSVYEGNETVSISIQSLSGDNEFTAGSGTTLTITENESAPEIELVVSSSSIAENAGSSLTLTVSSNQVSDEDVSVVIATSGTATEGTDYASIADLTITAGQTTTTASFTPTDDSIYEGDETATVSIDSVSGSDATTDGTQSVSITISENESAPTLTLTSSASSVAENGSALTLTATLSTATSEDVTVSLAVSGTATSGTDYTALSDMTITSGQTTTTASFTPSDDNVYEGDETAIIDVDSVSGGSATESGTQQLTLTISDNESAPTVTLTSSASSVSEDGSALTLTATLTNATTADVTITLSAGGTATEGTDYANLSDITVTAGDTTGTTSLTPTDDSTFEGDETITVDIDTVSGGSATENGTQQVSITLQEDDAGPTFTISDVTTSDESAANASVTVTLTPSSGLSATVDYATSDGTATAGSDYTSTSGTLTFAAGDTTKTISVPILADTTDENDETITVTLSNAVRSTIDDSTATITITDDDSAPSLSINDVTTADETASNATFTVSLSAASGKEITVAYATSDGTATAGSDYTSSSGTLTFDAGDTTKTFTVPVLGDSTDENNETVTLTLSSPSNASISDATGTLTITDDDSAPSLSINDVSSTDESNVATSLTVTLSAASGKDITVDYATSNGTATAGSDYTAASGTLTFSAGDTTQTIDITTLTDSVVEGDETVTVTLSNPSNASISDSTGTFTITDDDSSTFSVADVTAAEDAGTATITVTATNAFSSDVTIDYATSNGTATAGSDYTAASGTLTLSAGNTTKTFTVTISDDSTDENNETATITISNASSGSISDATATLTITDNDDAPSLSINDVTTANETAGNATFTVSLSAASGKEITVAYATSDGTATAGSDYTDTSGTLTFTAGQTSKTFSVPVLGDTTDENNETVTLTLSSASNASISDATGTLTITDDDDAPTLSINDISADEDGSTGTFTVTLSAASGKDITVDYATSNGTATAGSDYTAASGTLTISAGNSSGTIAVTILNDSTFEGDETVTMSLSNASNSSISDSSGTLTISEDDAGPTLTISDVTTSDESATNITVTVTLSPASGLTSSVDYATSDGTATAGSDYTSTSGTLNFSAGDTTKTFTVAVLGDSTDEENETITITLSNAVRASIGDETATITITDDDDAPTLSINDVSTGDEGDGSTNMTVSLSAASAKEITVDYATSDGTATAGSDYTSSSGTLTFAAGDTSKTIAVTVSDDSVYEGDETVTMTLSNASNASISDSTGTFTITEDENTPTVTLTTSSTSIVENSGSSLTLTATLSNATDENVTIALATSGTATEGTDYSSLSNITITALETYSTISFTPLDDASDPVFEENETAIIDIDTVNGGSATESGTQQLTLTITENESVTVTLSGTTSIDEKTGTATITATASVKADASMVILLSTGGTATPGTDYTALSNISILAGSTLGTTRLSPTYDQIQETSETAIISINSISGVTSTSAADTVTITITDEALDSGTTRSANASTQSTIESATDYTQIDYGYVNEGIDDTPYENIGLAEFLSYGLDGTGQTVAILDSGYMINGYGYTGTTHYDLNGDRDENGTVDNDFTVSGYGTFSTYSASSNSHGTQVAGAAVGDYGDGGIMGVGTGASLHLSDFSTNFQPSHWEAATDSAASAGAVVQNNSWGFDQQYGEYGIDDVVNYMNNNSTSGESALVYFQSQDENGDGYYTVGNSITQKTWTSSDWTGYIEALNDFQDTGVVVFALSNDSDRDEADISAGLPELFTELQEAWITAANIDINGSGSWDSKTFTLMSAPCGSTAEYCISGDGYGITLPGGNSFGSGNATFKLTAGTSFVAPQVSGAIAVLANHFPNHTPEQLVDRLLASANNDLNGTFSQAGTVTFSNGVVHAYTLEAGHGIMDLPAALSPITSSSYVRSIFTGAENLADNENRNELQKSYVVISSNSRSSVFGDSLSRSLKGQKSYYYDALGGGFEYEVSDHIVQEFDENIIDLKSEIKAIGSEYNGNTITFNTEKYYGSYFDKDFGSSRIIGSLTSAPPALQAFFNTNNNLLSAHIDTNTSYLTSKEGGYGLSVIEDLTDGTSISYGFSIPFMDSQEQSEVQRGRQTVGFVSTETEISKNQLLSFIIGNAAEEDNFLGLKGEGAYSFENTDSDTNFTGVKFSSLIDDNKRLSLMATMGESTMSIPSGMMVTGANDVRTSSYAIQYSQNNIWGKDKLVFNIDQPDRVEEGSMGVILTNLSDSEGNLSYRNENVELKPGGRQINLGIGYEREVNEDLIISAKLLYTQDNNHIKGNESNSYFIGSKYKDLRLGMTQSTNSDAEMRFEYNFNF